MARMRATIGLAVAAIWLAIPCSVGAAADSGTSPNAQELDNPVKRKNAASERAVFKAASTIAPDISLDSPPDLTVTGYDSILLGKHSLGAAIIPLFEQRCHCHVKTISSGDGGQLLTRLQIDAERGKPTAQVALGLDRAIFERAKPYLDTDWGGWKPKGSGDLEKVAYPEPGFLSFDYGYFALMADHDQLKKESLAEPRALKDLLKPEWRRRIALEDPRTSTPGLAFLLYTSKVESDPWAFWGAFRPQVLTFAPGWDAAYGLFLKGEAPLAWSYVTSQAYHEEHGDSAGRYKAVLFEEGQPVQVEGAALVKGGARSEGERKVAREFLEFLISPEVQKLVPTSNWMMPARRRTPLPESFGHLPKVTKAIELPSAASDIDSTLKRWSATVSGGGL